MHTITPTAVAEKAKQRQLTAGNVFSVAIANLRKLGWTRGEYHIGKPGIGQVCLMGAVENAISKLLNFEFDNHDDIAITTATVSTYLSSAYPNLFDGDSPEGWNDETAESVHEVIAALEHIAAKEATTPFDHLLAARDTTYA